MSKALIALLIMNVFVIPAMGCTCGHNAGMTFEKHAQVAPIVLLSTVLSIDRNPENRNSLPSMNVEVAEVIKGRVRYSVLTLFGDPGYLCLEALSDFKFQVGGRYLFVLYQNAKEQGLKSCHSSWMKVEGDSAYQIRGTEKAHSKWNLTPYLDLVARISKDAT